MWRTSGTLFSFGDSFPRTPPPAAPVYEVNNVSSLRDVQTSAGGGRRCEVVAVEQDVEGAARALLRSKGTSVQLAARFCLRLLVRS